MFPGGTWVDGPVPFHSCNQDENGREYEVVRCYKPALFVTELEWGSTVWLIATPYQPFTSRSCHSLHFPLSQHQLCSHSSLHCQIQTCPFSLLYSVANLKWFYRVNNNTVHLVLYPKPGMQKQAYHHVTATYTYTQCFILLKV